MGSESVKDLRDFQGNDLYKYRVLHYNILLFFTAMSIWGSLREQLMWHLLHKLLIMFFNMGKAQLLADGTCCTHHFLTWCVSHPRISTWPQFFLGSWVTFEVHHL